MNKKMNIQMNKKFSKKIALAFLMIFASAFMFAQKYQTVDVDDEIYIWLKNAETEGLCSKLSNVKPYTEKYILSKLDEISDALNSMEKTYAVKVELETVEACKNRFVHKNGLDLLKQVYRTENESEEFPTSFEFRNTMEGFLSSGFYKNNSQNSTGYEFWDEFYFSGDLGKYFSYNSSAFVDLTKMPLTMTGDDYYIGNWWYSTHDVEVKNPTAEEIAAADKVQRNIRPRTVKTYKNFSMLPFSYKKHWDGSIYYLENITGNGLESWPDTNSFGFGMTGEINGSFFDDKVELRIGRGNHEWAGMDNGSSLIMNSNARPFFGVNLNVNVFDNLSFSTLTGFMEFPNQRHINYDAWYLSDEEWAAYYKDELLGESSEYDYMVRGASPGIVDSYFFQNLFSISMITFDSEYLMIDFGTSCVYPKRFELGYSFPIIDRIVYQNNVGDYDNLQVFGDIKGKLPGVGSVWMSLFMDELYNPKQLFDHARSPFAFQAGVNAALPFLPFGSVSLRYTKLEPYCYTHPAAKVPWYKYYVSTSYTNNGESLGYYLPPNSDEINLSFDVKPTAFSTAGLNFQFMRHGTDWGNGAVEGSNIYSELVPRSDDRQAKMKYFLHDGTYEWTTFISVNGSYDFRKFGAPVMLTASVGYVYQWYTGVENNGVKNDSYSKISSEEYPEVSGIILSVGFKAFAF